MAKEDRQKDRGATEKNRRTDANEKHEAGKLIPASKVTERGIETADNYEYTDGTNIGP